MDRKKKVGFGWNEAIRKLADQEIETETYFEVKSKKRTVKLYVEDEISARIFFMRDYKKERIISITEKEE